MDLAGQIALVTGAAVRVGRATALELARAGADVIIHYHRSRPEAERTADEIRALGRRSLTVAADLAQPAAACDTLLAAVDAEFGRLDVLVNNASAYLPGSPADLAPEQWAYIFAANVTAPTMLAERAGRGMIDRGGGAIVNMLDIQARRPWPKYLASGMAKGAMWTATVGLARRFAPTVRVNGVAPGAVLWNPKDDPAVAERIIAQTPLGRIGRPEDAAKAVRFLLENDYMTGQVLGVDGGRSM